MFRSKAPREGHVQEPISRLLYLSILVVVRSVNEITAIFIVRIEELDNKRNVSKLVRLTCGWQQLP